MRRGSLAGEHATRGVEAASKALSSTLRGKAADNGLPPILAVATAISTAAQGNIVSYRGSEPITAGQYYQIITGQGRPKSVTHKEKSSNLEVTNGYLVENPAFGRYDKQADGSYAARQDKPPDGMERNNLEIPLRKIYNGLGEKFELVGPKNPDDQGILRFRQINHPSEDVRALTYSVNVNEAKPVAAEIIAYNKLVSNEYRNLNVKGDPQPNTPFYGLNLDAMCAVSGQQPGGDPKPIVTLGGIVRDCDVDMMTVPSSTKLKELLGKDDVKPYVEALDMSPHGAADAARANNARVEMVTRIMEIHDSRWDQYNRLKAEAGHAPGSNEEKKWEQDHAIQKPFIAENASRDMITAMVVTAGKGTPLQLYQALEINVIERKILSSTTSPDGTKVNISDLSSANPETKNAALMKVHEQDIQYSRETIAHSFIQHPSENYNEHYTSKRSSGVLISGPLIVTDEDKGISKLILNKDQKVDINPKWIAENSPGNSNADIWVGHFMAKSDTHYKDDAVVKAEVDKFLANPAHIEYIEKTLKEHEAHPKGLGVEASHNYLKNFIESHPEVKATLVDREAQRQEANKVEIDRPKMGI